LRYFSIILSIDNEVFLSIKRWSNINLRLMLSLTDLLRVQDLGLESTILTPKCPSASVNPANQLSENKSDISK